MSYFTFEVEIGKLRKLSLDFEFLTVKVIFHE